MSDGSPHSVKVPQLKRAYFWTPSDRLTGLNKCQNSQPLTQSKFDPCMQWTRPQGFMGAGVEPQNFLWGATERKFLGAMCKKKKRT